MKKFIPAFLFLYIFVIFATAEDNSDPSVMPAQAGIQPSSEICDLKSEIPCAVRVISNSRYFPALLNAIQSANKSIYACMYYISYFPSSSAPQRLSASNSSKVSQILNALADAKGRGVTVEVILDRGYESAGAGDMSKKNLRAYSFLKKHGIPVFYDDVGTLTHAKYIIIDEKTVISGSFNWSEKAMSDNREDGYYIVSDEIAAEKLREFREIPKYSPEPVKDSIPIPLEFIRNREFAAKMMARRDETAIDVYLWLQKKSYEQKTAIVRLTLEEIFEFYYKDHPVKLAEGEDYIQKFMKDMLRVYRKKYRFINKYLRDPSGKFIDIELSAENKPVEDSLYISGLYWSDGWNKRLTLRAKFCIFYILDKTASGRMGRYFTQEKYDAIHEYGGSVTAFSEGTGLLQRYNLIEKDINFKVGERNANGYILNDFYVYSDFEKAFSRLKSKTDPELFQIVSGLVESVNEISDIEVYKRYIYLGRKYGLEPLKYILKLCQSRTSGISPYRNFAYVETAIINKGEGK